MNKKFFQKAISLTAAAAIGCTNIIGSGFMLNAFADESELVSETKETSSELVNVIVKVSGDAVLATPEGIERGDDFLNTDQAVQMIDSLENTQTYVQDEIRNFYPELEIKYSYSVLYNGFSCEIPENLIEQVKALPYVESVVKMEQKSAPEMTTSPTLSGYPAYYDFTGCSGEGQVIAVIDTELDVTHPMFAAMDDSIQVKLTEEDIAEIASTIGFNVDIDPAQAYRSNKLPFVVDYFDDDPINAVSNSELYPADYHGTHVSGIAAGNQFVDEDGNTLSGIAKDAQLVFMAAANDNGLFYDFAIMAALEDAVKLHADVINMSFGVCGEIFGEHPLKEAYENAVNAGITICQSAGNDGDGSISGEVHTPDNPDRGMVNRNTISGLDMLTVASASNVYTQCNKCFTIGEDKFAYAETYRESDNVEHWLTDELSGEYGYVYCGLGMPEDFTQNDVTGKIVLVDCGGGLYVQDKAELAKNAGAVGIIAISFEGELLYGSLVENDLPSGFVSYEDGQKMIQAENKVLTLTEDTIDIDMPSSVVYDSSWGVHQNLELRPDIMGVGDHVESAAYDNTTDILSGTSMASPYVAGCMAVLNEYLQKKGIALDGAEKIRYMRNLVMTSAIPYEEDGMFVTPRRQGAGLISLNHVLADKVLLTGNEGESKIQLYDNLGDTFSFDLHLNNISDEDVNFASARLVLTTDDSIFDEEIQTNVIEGQQSLNCSADLDALLHIGAGENKTETVSVSLDSEQTTAIKEIFTNGFFVDGYLLLEGAENCCDISIPLLGFCGDWAQIPIFDDNFIVTTNMGDSKPVTDSISLAQLTTLIHEILQTIPEEEDISETSVYDLILDYATEEQLDKMKNLKTEEYYISPNGDGLADNIGMVVSTKRFYHYNGLNIYNDKGELLFTGEDTDVNTRPDTFNAEAFDIIDLEEGIYTAQITGYVNYQTSIENPQKKEFQFTVDKTAPVLNSELTEKDGRKILKITATDSNLDGIYITGFKDNSENDLKTLDMVNYATEVLTLEGTFNKHPFSTSELPLIGKFLSGTMLDTELENINFADVFVAEPDESGVFTFEYDITDFQSYTISAMDKAYNLSYIENEPTLAENIPQGVYICDNGLLCLTEENINLVNFKDGKSNDLFSNTHYTFENGILTLENGEQFSVYQTGDETIRFSSENTTLTLNYYIDGTLEDYPFYTTDQIEKRYRDVIINMYGYEDAKTEVSVHNGIASLNGYGIYEGRINWFGDYKLNIFTGEIVEATSENMPNLFPITFDDFAQGAVLSTVIDEKIYYFDFDSGKMISQENGAEMPISYTLNNTELQFNINMFDEKDTSIVFSDYSFPDDWNVAILTKATEVDAPPENMMLVYAGTPDTFRFYHNDELSAMAVDYYKAQHGDYTGTPECIVNEDCTITIQMTEEESYTVDTQFAHGINQAGEQIDLTSTLAPMENPFKNGVWFSYGENSGYYIFNDDNICDAYFLSGDTAYQFTYKMTANGAIIYIQGEEESIGSFEFSLYPQEDGTITMVGPDGYIERLTYLNEKSAEEFSFYTTDQLIDMAMAHTPVEAEAINTYENPEGTISFYLLDANGNVIDIYIIDPQTAEGTDFDGNPVDIKEAFVPEIPENAYSLEKLGEMAAKDYELKTGTKPEHVESSYNRDGSVTVCLSTEDDRSLDEYIVDPVTGKGTNRDGEKVNLPQTGNNTPDTAVKASVSVFSLIAGVFAVWKSGIFRKKKEN